MGMAASVPPATLCRKALRLGPDLFLIHELSSPNGNRSAYEVPPGPGRGWRVEGKHDHYTPAQHRAIRVNRCE